jgi:DNA-binding NarL/FixJ family response regulator
MTVSSSRETARQAVSQVTGDQASSPDVPPEPGIVSPADRSAREREVVSLIARKIYVSPSTAKTHAARAMTKLQARDRAQLVVFAYQAGLVRPDWS